MNKTPYYMLLRQLVDVLTPHMKRCVLCKAYFVPLRDDGIYCGIKCANVAAQRASRRRKRNGKN